MARKDRAPTPPKRSQGPQRRTAPSDPDAAARRKRTLFLVAGSGLVALAIVLAFIFVGGSSSDDDGAGDQAALEAAGCTLRSFPAQSNASDHSDVPTLESKPKWNSSPPTSGPHYGQTAVWGFYGPDEPVLLVQSTHNLEHGGVVIHYGPDVPEAQVDAMRTWYNELDDPNGLVVSPLATNTDKITLSAWTAPDASTGTRDRGRGWLGSCTTFDEDAFGAFIDEHRYMGPERLPPEQMAPGN